ncbi:MAG TPA: phytanoyl-CoA dioxygenase family protein [Burkholderiales bacterium]|jgi:Phytanoyl-CoA dioxygenase (PhyH)|nr:phytanoyl-CoA dioxygenase family protein [Burkholderiales bacterium]
MAQPPDISLTAEQRKTFNQQGFLLLPGFYDLDSEIRPIQQALYQIIGLVAENHGLPLKRPPFAPETFDAGYNALIAGDRGVGSAVYDAAKLIPAFLRLLASDKNERLFAAVRETDLVGIGAASFGIRIDNPHEEQFRSQWHQEFLYQPQSLDGLVYWSPLAEIRENMGPVEVCVGSHRDGLCVYRKGGKYANKSGAYRIGLADEAAVVRRYTTAAPLTRPGDLLILDYLTLHQSGFNVSERSRWSMQFRLFNFREPIGRKLGWRPSVTAGTEIESLFPDSFVD